MLVRSCMIVSLINRSRSHIRNSRDDSRWNHWGNGNGKDAGDYGLQIPNRSRKSGGLRDCLILVHIQGMRRNDGRKDGGDYTLEIWNCSIGL